MTPQPSDRGAVAVVASAIAALALVLGAMLVDVTVLVAHRLRVAAAADAAALAAAPATFDGRETAWSAASSVAAANDVRLVTCRCDANRSLAPRRVEVVVADAVDLVFFGRHQVTAASAALYSPLPP